ncbi:MAG: hypothetical protein JWS10_303 [Cypionkella sp.]|nr:hypothetical protein [Cypionkella sp.]
MVQCEFAAQKMQQPRHNLGVKLSALSFCAQISMSGRKLRADRARIGQRHALAQTFGFRRVVQAMQMFGVARAQYQSKRPLNRALAPAGVAREPRKPQ